VQEDGNAFDVRRGGWPVVVELQGSIGAFRIDAVEADKVDVWVESERSVEPLEERDGARAPGDRGRRSEGLEDDSDEGAVNGRQEVCVRGEEAAQGEGERDRPLAKWRVRQEVAETSGQVLHATGGAGGAHGPRAAGVGAEDLVATAVTANPQEAYLGLPADDHCPQFILHIGGQALTSLVALAGLGEERLQVLDEQLMEDGFQGAARLVRWGGIVWASRHAPRQRRALCQAKGQRSRESSRAGVRIPDGLSVRDPNAHAVAALGLAAHPGTGDGPG
jgi:hypothetical protein